MDVEESMDIGDDESADDVPELIGVEKNIEVMDVAGVAEDEEMVDTSKVLIVGCGGREHAIGVALDNSPNVSEVWVSNLNAGLVQLSKARVYDMVVKFAPFDDLLQLCRRETIFMVVVGPELQLAEGIADELRDGGIKVFGPKMDAAKIEHSKLYSKLFMQEYNIRTPLFAGFTGSCLVDQAQRFIIGIDKAKTFFNWKGYVVKPSNLHGGKGTLVADSAEEAVLALDDYYVGRRALRKNVPEALVVEQKIEGFEVTVQAFVDETGCYRLLPLCQDHKRRFEGEFGPFTSGMGAICPFDLFGEEYLPMLSEEVISRAINGLRSEKQLYCGILNVGIIIDVDAAPHVLEYNCRFGDPEAQSVIPLLKTDLYLLMKACCEGKLSDFTIDVEKKSVCAIDVVVRNYPNQDHRSNNLEVLNVENAQSRAIIYFCSTYLENNKYFTRSGRVLTVCAKADTLEEAIWNARRVASRIKFDTETVEYEADYRRDIGFVYDTKMIMAKYGLVHHFILRHSLRKLFLSFTTHVMRKAAVHNDVIGGWYGNKYEIHDPNRMGKFLIVSVCSTGTKMQLAQQMNANAVIGEDLVASCANAVLSRGGNPMFFSNNLTCGNLDIESAIEVLKGIREGCRLAQCHLVGCNISKMSNASYKTGIYNPSGMMLGMKYEGPILPLTDIMEEDDYIVGFQSSGLHCCGFEFMMQLVKIFGLDVEDPAPFDTDIKLGDAILTPTRIYNQLLPLVHAGLVVGNAHITEGGIMNAIAKILPPLMEAILDEPWIPNDIFLWLLGKGINFNDMMEQFNMGLGMVIILNGDYYSKKSIRQDWIGKYMTEKEYQLINPCIIGKLRYNPAKGGKVSMRYNVQESFLNMAARLVFKYPKLYPPFYHQKERVAVFVAGPIANLETLLIHTRSLSRAEIVLAISNITSSKGLDLAEKANVPIHVIAEKYFVNRQALEENIQRRLLKSKVKYICLVGFKIVLSKLFITKWSGRILNIHLSLLPAFEGLNPPKLALQAGVKVTGCTIHFVNEKKYFGKIISQEVVTVLIGDTIKTLKERIREAGNKIYPPALEALVRGKIRED